MAAMWLSRAVAASSVKTECFALYAKMGSAPTLASDASPRLPLFETNLAGGMTVDFVVSKANEDGFEGGLRAFFEYRDLKMNDATDGKVIAHVVRAKEGGHAEPKWHVHDVEFQMFYVLKGWAKFEYEGHGVITVKPGDCVHQPPGIRHREIEHSDDLDLLEVVLPADFKTRLVDAPA